MEEQKVPQINTLEQGETFVMQIPECCKLFAEGGDISKIDCPHTTKPEKKTKRNIGL